MSLSKEVANHLSTFSYDKDEQIEFLLKRIFLSLMLSIPKDGNELYVLFFYCSIFSIHLLIANIGISTNKIDQSHFNMYLW